MAIFYIYFIILISYYLILYNMETMIYKLTHLHNLIGMWGFFRISLIHTIKLPERYFGEGKCQSCWGHRAVKTWTARDQILLILLGNQFVSIDSFLELVVH